MSLTCLHCKGAKAQTNLYCDDCFLKIGRTDGPKNIPIVSGGAKHDQGKPPLDLIPYGPMREIALVFDFGKSKYGEFNWLGGITYRRLLSASLRHINAFIWGEDMDPESGRPHLAHAGCCVLMALQMFLTRPDMDDRFKP